MRQDMILKKISIMSMMLMLIVCLFSVFQDMSKEEILHAEVTRPNLSQEPVVEETVEPMTNMSELSVDTDVFSKLPSAIDDEMKQKLGGNFIAIEKPDTKGSDYEVKLTDLAVDRRIVLSVTGSAAHMIEADDIHRICQNNHYSGTACSLMDVVSGIAIQYQGTLTEDEETEITLDLRKTYGYQLYEDENYIFVSLVNPHDLYSTIIVLDAGHGGNDSGTYSSDNIYHEKDMNLDITLRLLTQLEKDDKLKIYLTRTSDRTLKLQQRVDLANDVGADLFLSVHCNANLSRSIHGTEVLYNDLQNDWETFNSKQFAQICQEELIQIIGLKDRGIVPRSQNVLIIGEAKVPVALVEVAFMSNANDLNFLKKDENRDLIATGIYNGIQRALRERNELENKKSEENHE